MSEVFINGVRDSLCFDKISFFWLKSRAIRASVANCLILNGFIFSGSVLLFHFIFSPLLACISALLPLKGLYEIAETGFLLLWILPIYFLSFFANTVWYQDIATNAFNINNMRTSKSTTVSARIADSLYRSILNMTFLAQTSIVSLIPVIGPLLYLLHVAMIYSTTCFEYRHVHAGWDGDTRIRAQHSLWLYFLGFGFPAALISAFLPRFVDSGILSLCLPFGIIAASCATPRPWGYPVYYFQVSVSVTDLFLQWWRRWIQRRG